MVVVVVDVLVVVDGGIVVGGGNTCPHCTSNDSHVLAGRARPPGLGQGQLEGQLLFTSTHWRAELARYRHLRTSQGFGVVVLQHAQGGNVVVGPVLVVGELIMLHGVLTNAPHSEGAGNPRAVGFSHAHLPPNVSK